MSTALINKRSAALKKARTFFEERAILETDCPILSQYASINATIDLIEAQSFSGKRYLSTSPEYPMKRLLAAGAPDIYFLGHVFRDGERGSHHNPEFTMAEWYRRGFTLEEMIEETLLFCKLFTGECPVERYTYHEAFAQFAGMEVPEDNLDYLMVTLVEPKLSREALTVISYYPASQAALAIKEGKVAHRFEIYCQGLELCNGYRELLDPVEHTLRLEEENAQRESLGKKKLPIDPLFLEALEEGMPDCSGVAVGFDRLLMIQMQTNKIDGVQLFSWEAV